jgi:hypothetical protein
VLGSRDTLTGSPGSALDNVNTFPLPDGALCWVLSEAALYALDKTSTAAADGSGTIAPAAGGPGRWIRRTQTGGPAPSVEVTSHWSNISPGAGVTFAGGFYIFSGLDNDFDPAITFGVSNAALAAHLSIVTGAATVDEVTIRVSTDGFTGSGIDDNGVRTPLASEDIVIPAGTAADSYFETAQKWNGRVTIETIAGTAVTCNYLFSKYFDANNVDFMVTGIECLWITSSNDANSNIELLHHQSTGWTFNAGADPDPPTAIANRTTDYGIDVQQSITNEQGAYKRSNLATTILGNDSEGVLFRVTSGTGNSFRSMDCAMSYRVL